MGIAGRNLTVILASRYISIEFQTNVILCLIWETINYQQLLLYSERISNIYRKLMIRLDTRCSVSLHHGIPLSVIQKKI